MFDVSKFFNQKAKINIEEKEKRLVISRCHFEVYVNDKLLLKEYIKTRPKRNKRMKELSEILAGTGAYFQIKYSYE